MKPVIPPKAALTRTLPAAAAAAAAAAADEQAKTQPADLGLTERRRFVRTLPVPLAVESNRDTDWATFQSLSGDK